MSKKLLIKLIKGKALRKHSLHGKKAASVLLKQFISGNKRCHTIDTPKPLYLKVCRNICEAQFLQRHNFPQNSQNLEKNSAVFQIFNDARSVILARARNRTWDLNITHTAVCGAISRSHFFNKVVYL